MKVYLSIYLFSKTLEYLCFRTSWEKKCTTKMMLLEKSPFPSFHFPCQQQVLVFLQFNFMKPSFFISCIYNTSTKLSQIPIRFAFSSMNFNVFVLFMLLLMKDWTGIFHCLKVENIAKFQLIYLIVLIISS